MSRFRKLSALLGANLDEIIEIESSDDYSEAYRYSEPRRLMEQRNAAIQSEVENIFEGYKADIEAAKAKAFSGGAPKSDQAKLAHEMAYQRHERLLTKTWELEGGPSIEGYDEIRQTGDAAAMEVYEQHGPLYAQPHERPALQSALEEGRRAREIQSMNPGQRKAYDEMQRLEDDLASTETNLSVQMPALLSGETELMDPTAHGAPELAGAGAEG